MKKNIWLVNYYAMPPHLESRLRTIKFAQYLTERGYYVTIISSSIMHNKNLNLIQDGSKYVTATYNGLNFIHINTLKYKSNGPLRILSLLQFHLKLHLLAKRFNKPDIVIHTAALPFGNLTYYTAKRNKAEYICEVLDLWPESFVAFGLVKRNNILLKLSYQAEKWLYKKSDKVVFSMEGGKKYIINKKWDIANHGPIDLSKVFYINNGVDLVDFDFNMNNCTIVDHDLLNESTFKVIYLGSIRRANNVKLLLEAASCLISFDNIEFLIYGDGDERPSLELFAKENNITNLKFKDKWVDPKYVPFILSKSSLNILNYSRNTIIQYGGSQSKLFQYLASGRPICSNQINEFCLIKKYNLGISSDFESKFEYSQAILNIMKLSREEYLTMGQRSRKIAEQFDYKVLTDKLIEIF